MVNNNNTKAFHCKEPKIKSFMVFLAVITIHPVMNELSNLESSLPVVSWCAEEKKIGTPEFDCFCSVLILSSSGLLIVFSICQFHVVTIIVVFFGF